ncbi:MAG: hypothetical protein GX227_04330 [Clostridiaceae bacterium]|nr:hypothetical protein [Clostridiaceae bacterium]
MKPNYSDLGMAHTMGKPLKEHIENQLINDLSFYSYSLNEYKFDWSDSCVEGKCIDYLGGSTDIYSNIKVFDENYNLY